MLPSVRAATLKSINVHLANETRQELHSTRSARTGSSYDQFSSHRYRLPYFWTNMLVSDAVQKQYTIEATKEGLDVDAMIPTGSRHARQPIWPSGIVTFTYHPPLEWQTRTKHSTPRNARPPVSSPFRCQPSALYTRSAFHSLASYRRAKRTGMEDIRASGQAVGAGLLDPTQCVRGIVDHHGC